MLTYVEKLERQMLRKTLAIKLRPNGVLAEPITKEQYEAWNQSNAALIDRYHTHCDRSPVVPENYSFVVLGEVHYANWQNRNCLFCGDQFGAHYEFECLCFECRTLWRREQFYSWWFERAELVKTIRKPVEKPFKQQLQLF